MEAQSQTDLRDDPQEQLPWTLDQISSWLHTVIPQLQTALLSDPPSTVEDMSARAKELKVGRRKRLCSLHVTILGDVYSLLQKQLKVFSCGFSFVVIDHTCLRCHFLHFLSVAQVLPINKKKCSEGFLSSYIYLFVGVIVVERISLSVWSLFVLPCLDMFLGVLPFPLKTENKNA